MEIETKIRTLAGLDATLQGYLGTNPFRWFDKQLPKQQMAIGTCVRILKVSGVPYYEQRGQNPMSVYRFQIDVLDFDPETARTVARAIVTWLGTADFASNAQFGSPVTTPAQFPTFIVNRRAGMEFQLDPAPHVETLDVRLYNLEP